MHYKKSKIVLFLTVVSLFFSNTLWAKIGVLPNRVEGIIPCEKSYENVFKLTNQTDSAADVSIHWEDRTIKPLTKDWLSVSPAQIKIPAGGSAEIKYKITMPKNASGEYNAWIIFTEAPIGNIMGASLSIRISIPIYIAVRNTEKFDFEIKKMSITNDKNTTFKIYLFNSGNVHIRPKGSITIISENQKKTYVMPFNSIEWAIVPGEGGDYLNKFKDEQVLPDGKYTAKIAIEAGNEDGKKEKTKEITFEVKDKTATIIEEAKPEGNQVPEQKK